jgi:hypothetical protein
MLLDRAGNDRYKAPYLSFGGGNANGIGWFLDLAGDDSYESAGITLGQGAESPKGSMRERGLCFGLFMDLAGTDKYPAVPWAANGKQSAQWTVRQARPSESQGGVFYDY